MPWPPPMYVADWLVVHWLGAQKMQIQGLIQEFWLGEGENICLSVRRVLDM